MDSILVSCIIPTYQRTTLLEKSLVSIINQTHKNLEIIVVDDNHNNEYSLEVKKIIKQLNDIRIVYLKPEKHINGANARNVGIRHAKGMFISFLDDDDEWIADKVEKQLRVLINKPDYNGATCFYGYYKDNKLIRESTKYGPENLPFNILMRNISVGTPTLMIRKESLSNEKLFDITLKRHQELQFLLDFLQDNKLLIINETLLKVNVDDAQNRPNTDEIISIKNDFFCSIENIMNNLSKRDSKRVYKAHYFEIIHVAIKNKNYIVALKYIFKIGFSLRSYMDLIKRIKSRKKGTFKWEI